MDELARIGARDDGGVCRLAFSESDLEARDYVETCLRELDAEIRIDAVGNLFGIVRTGRPGPVVMAGSHTDTVATGGRFDGSLGVLAAVEVASAIAEAEAAASGGTFIVADFVNEEGVRFMPDMMGSLFLRGDLDIGAVRKIRDADGVSIGHELDRLGYAGSDALSDLGMDFFVELHIEQGPVLENSGQSIGVVTGVQGLKWFEITASGASNHAGTTPMQDRRDAGRAAARLIDHLYQLTEEVDGLRMTVGSVRVRPNLINVIPDLFTFTVDIRHPNPDVLEDVDRQIRARVRAADGEFGCEVSIESLADASPVDFDGQVVDAIADAATEMGLGARKMMSGAGHDAQILASSIPSGMIFVPSQDGISHNLNEFTAADDLVAGANVLLGTVLRLMKFGAVS